MTFNRSTKLFDLHTSIRVQGKFKVVDSPLGTTCPLLTLESHLAPAFVRALIWSCLCNPIICTRLGRFFLLMRSCVQYVNGASLNDVQVHCRFVQFNLTTVIGNLKGLTLRTTWLYMVQEFSLATDEIKVMCECRVLTFCT